MELRNTRGARGGGGGGGGGGWGSSGCIKRPLDSYLSLYFIIVQHNNKITIWKIDMFKSKERHLYIDLRWEPYLFKSNM
jgi:hypothetical protein